MVAVAQVATPELKLTLVQISVPSALKVTVPPGGAGVTVAVKVTDVPAIDGFAEDVKLVVVGRCCTS
jgi:hypothetical protein